ncbi:class I SAM-dependent methyltransferase [Nakamurella flava]|uniref:class I SAM-dependent methyltransferase n=1 Tax=Nakamurella flava TaxID=2576308 RepID=UPI00197B61B3|nr:class I SAM-dependent methyltransferase [Nakamurella flava]
MSEQLTAEELGERVFHSALAGLETLSIHLGDTLGWYRSLADDGPATADELAARTSTTPRYAREWLEQQAVAGYLTVADDAGGEAADRRFALTAAAREVFTDGESLSYLAPLARLVAAVGVQMPGLQRAYRDGGGVGWAQFGDDMRTAQADMNRPWYRHELPGVLAALPGVHDRLARPGARILDIGCGAGHSTVALATAYPQATVLGIDIDAPSVELARQAAVDGGVADRVEFRVGDASAPDLRPGSDARFTAAFAFECIHDMPRPVDVLRQVHDVLDPQGVMVVMDEATAEAFAPNGDEVERMLYAFSVTVCLPDGLSSSPSVGTGTVMRPDTLRRYASEAGFSDVEVLPTGEFGFWRFYALNP